MSSSMPIPTRKQPTRNTTTSSYSSSSSPTPSPTNNTHNHRTPSAKALGKAPITDTPSLPPASPPASYERRRSLLGFSLSKSEYTVVDLGENGGGGAPTRLVTCVKAGQGFDWNQELFLPSYVDCEGVDLERKQDPVEDIVLTDEEADGFLPR